MARIDQALGTVVLEASQGGIRNAEKKFQTIRDLAHSQLLHRTAAQYLSGKPKLVRAILFDKTPSNNWLVNWHQDTTIAVSTKMEIEGWGPWSIKDGQHHVQPTLDVLNKMVTIRIHIDDNTRENGCLKLVPGSHHHGLLSPEQIHEITQREHARDCIVKSGSALVMRPHLLHASSKALLPSHRRIVHLEYSSYLLPNNLNWAND